MNPYFPVVCHFCKVVSLSLEKAVVKFFKVLEFAALSCHFTENPTKATANFFMNMLPLPLLIVHSSPHLAYIPLVRGPQKTHNTCEANQVLFSW